MIQSRQRRISTPPSFEFLPDDSEEAILVAPVVPRRSFAVRSVVSFTLLSLLLLPFFYGGKQDTALLVFQCGTFLLGLTLGLRRLLLASAASSAVKREESLELEFSLPTCLLGFALSAFGFLVVLQTIPLPLGVLGVLSPETAAVYRLSSASVGYLSIQPAVTESAYWLFFSIAAICIALSAVPLESVPIRRRSRHRGRNREGSPGRRASRARATDTRHDSDRNRERLVHLFQRAIIFLGALCSIVAVVHWTLQAEQLFGFFSPQRTLYLGTTPHWPFVNPDHLSVLLEIAVVICSSHFLRRLYLERYQTSSTSVEPENSFMRAIRRPEQFGQVFYLAAAIFFMMLCNLLTLSRTGNSLALFGVAILAINYLRMTPARTRRSSSLARGRSGRLTTVFGRFAGIRWIQFAALTLALMSSVSFFLGEAGRHSLNQRVEYGLTVKYDEIRAELSRASLDVLGHFPSFGVGLGNWGLAANRFGSEEFAGFSLDYAHNEPLQIAAETGVAGSALVLIGLGAVLVWTWRVWRMPLMTGDRIDLLGTSLALFLPLVHSVVDFPLHIPGLALVIAVCLSLHLRSLSWCSKRSEENVSV